MWGGLKGAPKSYWRNKRQWELSQAYEGLVSYFKPPLHLHPLFSWLPHRWSSSDKFVCLPEISHKDHSIHDVSAAPFDTRSFNQCLLAWYLSPLPTSPLPILLWDAAAGPIAPDCLSLHMRLSQCETYCFLTAKARSAPCYHVGLYNVSSLLLHRHAWWL